MKFAAPLRPPFLNKSLPAVVCGLLAVTLSSCTSPGFNAAYRKSVAEHRAADAKPEVAGPWQGYWKSDVNGHTGHLRAVAQPAPEVAPGDGDGGGETFLFRYHATWAKVLSGGYTSPHAVHRSGTGAYTVEGEKDIAFLGTYKSEGTIRGDKFESKYHSESDHGVYVMQRPQ